jgi:hypothetical protein
MRHLTTGERVRLYDRVQHPGYSDYHTLRFDDLGEAEVLGHFHFVHQAGAADYYAVRVLDTGLLRKTLERADSEDRGEVVAARRAADGRLCLDRCHGMHTMSTGLLQRALARPGRKVSDGHGQSVRVSTPKELAAV